MTAIRVLVADDQRVVREGLTTILGLRSPSSGTWSRPSPKGSGRCPTG